MWEAVIYKDCRKEVDNQLNIDLCLGNYSSTIYVLIKKRRQASTSTGCFSTFIGLASGIGYKTRATPHHKRLEWPLVCTWRIEWERIETQPKEFCWAVENETNLFLGKQDLFYR